MQVVPVVMTVCGAGKREQKMSIILKHTTYTPPRRERECARERRETHDDFAWMVSTFET